MSARSRVHFGDAAPAIWLFVAASLVVGCGETPKNVAAPDIAAAASAEPQAPPKVTLNGVAALATEWYPNQSEVNSTTDNRLLREVVRQGVLMALREELGLVTRDETLGESLTLANAGEADAAASPVDPLSLSFDWDRADGGWHAELSGAGAPGDNPIWKHDGAFKFNNRTLYADFAAQMAQLSEPIAEQLRAAGAKGTRRELNPENVPPPQTEAQLSELNFVSQFAAVRAAHQAIADKGPSLPWLGVLVRGYANLAMLTQHNWSSHQDAFAARSILYAERYLELSGQSRSAELHHAYAYALVGLHGHALDLLAASRQKQQSSGAGSEPEPAWAALIEPFATFKPAEIERLAEGQDELAELAALLRWNVYRHYMHGPWIKDIGLESMAACPEAYSIYSVMANWPALGVKRLGASAAIESFGKLLSERLAALPQAPKSVQALGAPKSSLLSSLLGARSSSGLSDRPIKMAHALRAATDEESQPTEFSWAILGNLIAEEQFVQAANLLTVAGDAVEHSRAGLVEKVRPLVEGHPYANYIESFAISPNDASQKEELMRGVRIVDPRPSMRRMFTAAWLTPAGEGGNGYDYSCRTIWSRTLTHPSLHDNWYGVSEGWVADVPAEHRRYFALEFREISPHSPQATRLHWENLPNGDAEHMAAWEKELGEDPVGWSRLALRHYQMKNFDAAVRCYERSIEIGPSYDATVGLADAYYYAGKKELWKPTLESYLKVEDLGLNHAQIHQLLADDCIRRRSWNEGEPHALAAAETYASWGLELASAVYEGGRKWDQSEQFVAEAARHYPSSSSGASWYLWCRRNGRGDLDAAREIAEQSIALSGASADLDSAQRTFVYRLLEGDVEKALPGLEGQLKLTSLKEEFWSQAWRLLHTIALADETDDADRKKRAIEELRGLSKQEYKSSDAGWPMVLETLALAFEGQEPSPETLARYDEVIEGGSLHGRCNYQYYMGAALNSLGQLEAADDYWARAAFGGPFSNYNCTLAGHRLAVRQGPDRGGLPERYVKQEAGAEAEWAKRRAEAEANEPQQPTEDAADAEQPEADRSI